MARQCAERDACYEEFLERLAERELAARQAKATERRLRRAGLPAVKELSDFDFTALPMLNNKRVTDLARGEFIEQRAKIVLCGASGVGKSHLVIARGREARRRGYRVKFFTAAGLVTTYLEAREQRQVLRLQAHVALCQLLLGDELGHVPPDKLGAEHLFGVFSRVLRADEPYRYHELAVCRVAARFRG
ncbi:MAG: ATP-binding protein [Pirellulales bacterium]|nr:ATP-binding protein [Pirellulales bacterium]